MRNLKIYKATRSVYLLKIAYEIPSGSKWSVVRLKYDINIKEWGAIAGYWTSNDYTGNRIIKIKKAKKKERKLRIQKLRKLPYDQYLKSEHWDQIKQEVRRVFKTCVICNSGVHLHVHHRSYKYKGIQNKEIKDLILLCSECHSLFHTHGKLIK